MSSNPEIIIDEYLFKLISYDPLALGNRGIVEIMSRSINPSDKKSYYFFLYRSNSDLGFWRLCKEKIDKTLDKGPHYVLHTLVHIELQFFINKNLDKLLILDGELDCSYDISSSKDEYYLVNEMMKKSSRKINPKLSRHTNNLDSNLNDKYGFCGTKVTTSQVKNGSDYLENNYLVGNITKIGKYDYEFNNPQTEFYVDLKSTMYSIVLTEKSNTNNNSSKNSDENLILYYLHISSLTLDGGILPDKIHAPISFAPTLEESLQIKEIEKKKSINNIYLPIFLGPEINKVNVLGLYDKYIDMGGYVCKIIEYIRSCYDSAPLHCRSIYRLQEQLYSQPIFPFNDPNFLDKITATGIKKSKNKRKQQKRKGRKQKKSIKNK
jgi:hypothetical protein